MIVADTNLIAYFLIPGGFTQGARAVYQRDPEWVAPPLWRSEFRNVLILSFRHNVLSLDDVHILMDRAERLMNGQNYQVDSRQILQLAAKSGCAAYDCEFVALAQELGVPLVTSDRALIKKLAPTAVSMQAFCS